MICDDLEYATWLKMIVNNSYMHFFDNSSLFVIPIQSLMMGEVFHDSTPNPIA